MSFLSILLTVFEYISADSLLKNEVVLVIKMFISSNDISKLNEYQFKKFTNLRKPISNEISKMTNIDCRLIELLNQNKQKMVVIYYFIFELLIYMQIRRK